MNKMKISLFFVVFTLVSYAVNSCTIVALSDGKTVLVGNNEDFRNTSTHYWSIPASKSEYGRICFGFDIKNHLATCGGVNDQGLFIDGCSVDPPDSPTGYIPEEGKKRFRGNLEEYVLANCSSLKDVKKVFNTFNVGLLSRGKWLVAEKSGASMVVEWWDGKIQFLNRKKKYQIATNFTRSKYLSGNIPCHRYRIVDKLLKNSSGYSLDLMRKLLSITHLGGGRGISTTLFSYICDLKNGNIYIYNFHNFEDVRRINIHEELKKGKKSHSILSLFPYETFAEKLYKLIQKNS